MAPGGMNIDDSTSYRAAARWAGVVDNEVQRHVSSLSLWANGGHSKGSGKDCDDARTRGRFAMASQPESDIATLPCRFVEARWVKYPQYPRYPHLGYPQPTEHQGSVVAIMKLSADGYDFRAKLDRLHPRHGKPTQRSVEFAEDEETDTGKGL